MNLKLFVAMAAALVAGSAHAASDFVDTAQVISSKPRIEKVTESRQECDAAPAPKKETSILGPIIGGVAGGLLGHQVGQGRGQTAATVIGATGGAVAGSVIADRNNANAQPPQQCRTIETTREVVNGYDVVYRYNGRDISTVLPNNPGNTLKVGVAVVGDERAVEPERRNIDKDDRRERDGRGRRERDGGGPPPGPRGGDNYQYRY